MCTGIGGAELALELMGLEPDLRWYCEVDKDASAVLAERFPAVPNLGDLTTIDWGGVAPVDIVTAGYPCQGESLAGKRRGADDERWIWPDIARALRILRPRIVLAENVAAHLSLGFAIVLGDLAALGFDVEWSTFRASDVGSCHQRDRIFWAAIDRSGGGLTLLPTPSALESTPTDEYVEECREAGLSADERLYLPGRRWHVQRTLSRVAPLLPTPNAADGTGGKLHKKGSISPTGMKADGTKVQVSLRDALTMMTDDA